jgi:hypothetical protein
MHGAGAGKGASGHVAPSWVTSSTGRRWSRWAPEHKDPQEHTRASARVTRVRTGCGPDHNQGKNVCTWCKGKSLRPRRACTGCRGKWVRPRGPAPGAEERGAGHVGPAPGAEAMVGNPFRTRTWCREIPGKASALRRVCGRGRRRLMILYRHRGPPLAWGITGTQVVRTRAAQATEGPHRVRTVRASSRQSGAPCAGGHHPDARRAAVHAGQARLSMIGSACSAEQIQAGGRGSARGAEPRHPGGRGSARPHGRQAPETKGPALTGEPAR